MIRKIFVSLPLYVRESFRKAAEISNHTGMSRCATALDLISSKIRHGASFEDYVALEFFRKNNRERARYVTTDKNVKDLYLRISDMNAATTINEKDKFAQKFRDFLGRDCICVDKSNLKDAFSFVDRYGKAIAKPYDGYEGNGIFMINSEKKDTLERLQNLVIGGGKFMVEELIVQHPAMAALNKESVNTVRIETMIDRNGESHITNTTVIMGSGGDIINNTHNGGIMCHIDPESGVISSSARDPHGVNLFRHPDTGMILPGYQIPMWKEAKEFALKLSKVVPGVVKFNREVRRILIEKCAGS